MADTDTQYEKMVKTPIPKLIRLLAVPTIVSMLITSVYNVADAYFVAKLGTSASAAIGIVFSLMAMIQAIGFTLGMGASSAISRLLGKQKEDEAQEIASSALALSVLSGIVLSMVGLIFLEPFMLLLGATQSILPYAMEYARYILYTAPVMITAFVLNNLLRAEGKSRLAMIGIGAGGICNILLDPIFIFCFQWGIKGAALATATGQCISLLILLSCFLRKKTILRFAFGNISRKMLVYKTFLGNGMPSLFRQGLASVATVALNLVAAGEGDAAVAAMAVVGKIFMVVFSVLIGFGQGYQPVAGYNYGAGEYERVNRAYRFTLWTGVAGMLILGTALYISSPWLVEWFGSGNEKVIEMGTEALRFQCIAMPFMPLGAVCNLTCQALGRSMMGTFLASCRQGVFFLPFICLLPAWFGTVGMELAQPLADVATFAVCIPIIYQFKKSLKIQK